MVSVVSPLYAACLLLGSCDRTVRVGETSEAGLCSHLLGFYQMGGVSGSRYRVSEKSGGDGHSRNNCALDLRGGGPELRSGVWVGRLWGANECVGAAVAAKTVEKKSVGRSDSVWRGPRGRSQLPLEFNRRSGRGYSTRIGLEE